MAPRHVNAGRPSPPPCPLADEIQGINGAIDAGPIIAGHGPWWASNWQVTNTGYLTSGVSDPIVP
jgi:hypothetical protein